MRHGALGFFLVGAAALGGCSEGVLDPKGPVAAAERLIMLNSTGIMLAIVIPTILATLGTAFGFAPPTHVHATCRILPIPAALSCSSGRFRS